MVASEQGGIDDAVAERLPADPALRDAQVLIDWNAIGIAKSLEVDGFQTLTTNRAMPLMHLAVHDALNAIAPVYARHGEIGTDAEGHPVATVSQAAHDVLAEEYPDHAAAFAELHAQWLDEVPQGTAKEHGRELGAATAAATLDARADDGHDSEGSFSPREEPGAYRLTPPHEAPAGTGRAETEPLAMEAPDQFRPGPPLQIDSARYAEEFDEVNRTPRARNSAVYWGLGFFVDIGLIVQEICTPGKSGRFIVGSMSRRGNPYDDPQAESFMKTLKVGAVYLTGYDTYDEVAADFSRFIDEVCNARRLQSALGYLSPIQFEDRNARTPVKAAA